MVTRGLDIGFILDRRWHALRGEMETTKRPALVALARVLADTATPYAIIGGIAVQVHQAQPRTTLDIDLAVTTLRTIPRAELEASGFSPTGRFTHTENWLGPEKVPVQFTDDPALALAVERAVEIELDGVLIRVIGRSDLLHEKLRAGSDLLHEKLRAGSDPARRRSKRLQDLADAEALLEATPTLRGELSEAEQTLLGSLPA